MKLLNKMNRIQKWLKLSGIAMVFPFGLYALLSMEEESVRREILRSAIQEAQQPPAAMDRALAEMSAPQKAVVPTEPDVSPGDVAAEEARRSAELAARQQQEAARQAAAERAQLEAMREELAYRQQARELEQRALQQRRKAQYQQQLAQQQMMEARYQAQEQASYEMRRYQRQMNNRLGYLGY